MDEFFKKTHCDRCHKPLNGVRIMSMYNHDCLCMECKEAETHREDYEHARQCDHEHIIAGNYNFEGIGL